MNAVKDGMTIAARLTGTLTGDHLRSVAVDRRRQIEITVEDEATAVGVASTHGLSLSPMLSESGPTRWSTWIGVVGGFEVRVTWFGWPATGAVAS